MVIRFILCFSSLSFACFPTIFSFQIYLFIIRIPHPSLHKSIEAGSTVA